MHPRSKSSTDSKLLIPRKPGRTVRFQRLVPQKKSSSRSNPSDFRRPRAFNTNNPQSPCQKPLPTVQRAVSLPVDLGPIEKSSKRLFWFIRPAKRFRRMDGFETPSSLEDGQPPNVNLRWLASPSCDNNFDDDASGNTEDHCDQDLVGLEFLCEGTERHDATLSDYVKE